MKRTIVTAFLTTFFLLVFLRINKVLAFLPENQAKMAMGIHNLIYSDFSTADAQWIGNNTDLLMIQSPFKQVYKDRVTKLANVAKNANPNLKIYLYKNWLRSGTEGNKEFSVNILEDTTHVPVSVYSRYFKYLNPVGQPITGGECEYLKVKDTEYCMKFLLPDWQNYFIGKSLTEANEYGTVTVVGNQVPAVDGIFIDELKNRDKNLSHLRNFSAHPSGGKFLVNAGDDCRMLFSTGCQDPKNGGYCGFCPETSQATAGIMDETFMTNWDYAEDNKCQNPYMSPQVVRNQLWQAQEAVKLNKLHWLVLRTGPYNAFPGCVSHRQLLSYTFAGYLLVADGKNVYFYSKTDLSSGDLGYYRNEFDINPDKDLYRIPLGSADSAYQEIDTGSEYYFKRSFSGGKGLVIVNPNNNPVANIALPPGKVFRDQDGNEYQNSINIAKHQGIILVDKNYSPGPIPTSTPVPTVTPGSTISPALSPQVTASPSGEPLINFMGFSFNPLLIAAMSTVLVVIGMILL